MAGLGVGVGGPPGPKNDADCRSLLHTSIHNYFLNEGFPELAQAIRGSKLSINQEKLKKEGPNHQINGADDGLDGDNKDDVKLRNNLPGETLLLEYWFIFWDLWRASKDRGAKPLDTVTQQYLLQQQQRAQMRQPMMQQPIMGFPNGFGRGGPNGMNNLGRTAMANSGRAASINPQFTRGPQQMGQHPMQRDGSDMDINGQQQPGSPMSADNARSPKRQRVEGQFNGQQMGGPMRGVMGGPLPNGAVGNHQAMMMQNGFDPKSLSPSTVPGLIGQNKQGTIDYSASLAEHQRSAMTMNAFQTNGFTPNLQMSPSMAGADGFDMMQLQNGQQMRQNQNGAGNGGALADYQMQLMLLEQQNKKRLMMARQEQDVHSSNGPMIGGPGNFGPPGTSPHGRGVSPPNDTKRNTPKPGQGSPLPDGSMPHNRSSPAPGNFDANQMGQMGGQFIPQMSKGMMGEGMVGPNGQMIRPPSSHPVGPQGMNGQRLPNGQWAGAPMPGQMMGQVLGGQPNQPESNQPNAPPSQQRGNMPPPQAPAGGIKAQSSPTPQNNQPPTPSTASKPPSKGRSNPKDKPKKKTTKGGGTTNATPNPENERPPTPTPPTPITPSHPEAATIKGQQGQHQDQNSQAQQQVQSTNMAQQQANNQQLGPGMPSGSNINEPFGSSDMFNQDIFDMSGGMDMADTNGILDGFDFETFINEPMVGWTEDFSMPGDGGLGTETGQ